jgi:beta-phosphoglucomutase-like phosphatase (HAD superfamily)
MSVYVAVISTAPRPELIIFDYDGVLVDSEPLSFAVLGELIATNSLEMQPETVQACFQGRSLSSTVKDLQALYQVAISEKDCSFPKIVNSMKTVSNSLTWFLKPWEI